MKYTLDDSECNKELYESAVGSLLYISTITLPDIAYAVGNLAKFCSKPSLVHWTAIKRVLRYLQDTVKLEANYNHV